MRFLLTGANGQLATDIRRILPPDKVVPLTHEQFDICDGQAVEKLVQQFRPDCIINTAAFNRVDDCEDQPDRALAVNSVGVYHLARAADRTNAALVHFSTDYVFDGTKRTPYIETDSPRPLSIYGMSKLAGEWAVQTYAERHFIIRTCGLYGLAGSRSKGGNFVERMLERAREGKPIRVVSDQILTPTSARELAERVVPLIRAAPYGLYHMTNSGECSWYEFAQEVFRLTHLSPDLSPTSSQAFAAKAVRPPYSVLDNRALRVAGFPDFRPWPEALADYLRERLPR